MSSKVYFTMLNKDEDKAKEIFLTLKNYGLDVEGHFWKDDLQNMSWASSKNDLTSGKYKAWIICGNESDFKVKSTLQGLTLLLLAKKEDLNVIVLIKSSDVDKFKKELPFIWQNINFVSLDFSFATKVVAKIHLPFKKLSLPYEIKPYAVPGLGLWLEINPANEEWDGVLIGARNAKIKHMGIGQPGKLPEKSILEYPVRDLKLEVDEKEFVCWAVQNKIDKNNVAFINFDGVPEELVLGPWNKEQPTVYTFSLC
ncbi:hypothetical protein [Desulfonauticus submarinus]